MEDCENYLDVQKKELQYVYEIIFREFEKL